MANLRIDLFRKNVKRNVDIPRERMLIEDVSFPVG